MSVSALGAAATQASALAGSDLRLSSAVGQDASGADVLPEIATLACQPIDHLPFSHIFCNMNKKTVLPCGNLLRYAHSARPGRHKRPGLQEYFETGCLPDQYAKKEYCSPDTQHRQPRHTRRRTARDLV
ncbi:hypothetical protein [Janthinobacterium sp. BJB426]|uniref:hypothetical protein n=1 Tax=Janthinobacterium sp. BJB426 TaxID=2048010 RepID=UPI001F46A924|nr:hypothetical protein [Janthinobacterium sp. BJB426]